MAKLNHVPRNAGFKPLEEELTRFFTELARENDLEVKNNPIAIDDSPIFAHREAYDPQSDSTLHLWFVYGRETYHKVVLQFGINIETERLCTVSESLGIERVLIDGSHYKRRGSQFLGGAYNKKTHSFFYQKNKVKLHGFLSRESLLNHRKHNGVFHCSEFGVHHLILYRETVQFFLIFYQTNEVRLHK